MPQLKSKKDKGFTLAELLVVIAIIGLLSSITLVALSGVRKKASIAKTIQFSTNIYHALGDSTLGFWDFNGDFKDSSGGNHTATPNNVTIVDHTDPQFKQNLQKAVSLTGNDNSYLQINNPGELSPNNIINEVTIEMWINPNSVSGWQTLLQNPHHYCIYLSGKSICFIKEGTGAYDCPLHPVVTAGKWHHIAATYDSNRQNEEIKVFVDSQLVYSLHQEIGTYPGGYPIPFTIGGSNESNPSLLCHESHFNGLIDRVRIYNRSF